MAAFLNCLFHGCYTIPTSLIAWLRSCRAGGHAIPTTAQEYDDDDRDISEAIALEAAKTNGSHVVEAKLESEPLQQQQQLDEDVEDSNALERWWSQSSVRAAMSKLIPSSSSSQPLRHAEDLGLIDLDDEEEEDDDDDVENSH